jgi:hypothetical protein
MTHLLVAILLVLPVALLGSDPDQVALTKLKNVTKTISGAPLNEATLRAALKADGWLAPASSMPMPWTTGSLAPPPTPRPS